MKQIKPYNQIKVGDIAMEHPDAGGCWDHQLGKIVWKGTMEELKKSKHSNLLEYWLVESEEELDEIAEFYDLVIVETTGWDGGPTLFGYDNDPCSCVVFED